MAKKEKKYDKYGDEKATPVQWIVFIIVVLLVVGFLAFNMLSMLFGDENTTSNAILNIFNLI